MVVVFGSCSVCFFSFFFLGGEGPNKRDVDEDLLFVFLKVCCVSSGLAILLVDVSHAKAF